MGFAVKSGDAFGSPQPGDVVYLISDAGDNASKTRPRQVDTSLREGIRLFAYLLTRSASGFQLPENPRLQPATQALQPQVLKRN